MENALPHALISLPRQLVQPIKGFLLRKRSSEDERILVVTLSDSGKKLREKAVEIPFKMQGCISIDEKDAAELYRILHKIMESINSPE